MVTFSGHRNLPGQSGLAVSTETYLKIDKVYGPSSWGAVWHERPDGTLYVSSWHYSDRYPIIEMGTIDDVLFEDGKTWKDLEN